MFRIHMSRSIKKFQLQGYIGERSISIFYNGRGIFETRMREDSSGGGGCFVGHKTEDSNLKGRNFKYIYLSLFKIRNPRLEKEIVLQTL